MPRTAGELFGPAARHAGSIVDTEFHERILEEAATAPSGVEEHAPRFGPGEEQRKARDAGARAQVEESTAEPGAHRSDQGIRMFDVKLDRAGAHEPQFPRPLQHPNQALSGIRGGHRVGSVGPDHNPAPRLLAL